MFAPPKDVIMRPTTTTALALTGTALALPAGVALAASENPPSPTNATLAAPFAGHLSTNARLKAERRDALAHRFIPRVIRVKRRTAKLKGEKFNARAHRERLRGASIGELRIELRRSRRELRRAKLAAAAPSTASGTGSVAPGNLQAIAACESGGDPHSIGGGGAFRGKYQFTYGTWASVGGSGDPAAAAEAEQDKRAQMLLAKSGSSPWPVCGQ
jgi:hypothetical protein